MALRFGKRHRVLLGTAVAAVATAGALAFGMAPAQADAGLGMHVVSNPNGADVHTTPAGYYEGWLAPGDHFDTTRHDSSGVWCDGYAYGSVNQSGWVLCQDLTPGD